MPATRPAPLGCPVFVHGLVTWALTPWSAPQAAAREPGASSAVAACGPLCDLSQWGGVESVREREAAMDSVVALTALLLPQRLSKLQGARGWARPAGLQLSQSAPLRKGSAPAAVLRCCLCYLRGPRGQKVSLSWPGCERERGVCASVGSVVLVLSQRTSCWSPQLFKFSARLKQRNHLFLVVHQDL